MSYSNYQSIGSAAKMMCPFRLAQRRPIRSIIYLIAGALLILLDCTFSKHLLRYTITNEPVFAVLLAVSGFSVLIDLVSIKRSFSAGNAYVLSRFSSITVSLFLTAAAILASHYFSGYLFLVLILCSLCRLYTPSVKKSYVPLLFGFVVFIGVMIMAKTVFKELNAAKYTETILREIYPLSTAVVTKIKDFIVSRW